MKKGDKLRVIVNKGDRLLCGAFLRKGQIIRPVSFEAGRTMLITDGKRTWYIITDAVEAVSDA